MGEKLIAQIQDNMNSKSTEELLDIIEENNRDEWSEQAFEAMRRILKTRDVKPHFFLDEIISVKNEITPAKEKITIAVFIKKYIWYFIVGVLFYRMEPPIFGEYNIIGVPLLFVSFYGIDSWLVRKFIYFLLSCIVFGLGPYLKELYFMP